MCENPCRCGFSATCGAPAHRSAGACFAPRAAFTAVGRRWRPRAPPLCRGKSCPGFGIPGQRGSLCRQGLKVLGPPQLGLPHLRLDLAGRPISKSKSMSYSLSSNLSCVLTTTLSSFLALLLLSGLTRGVCSWSYLAKVLRGRRPFLQQCWRWSRCAEALIKASLFCAHTRPWRWISGSSAPLPVGECLRFVSLAMSAGWV